MRVTLLPGFCAKLTIFAFIVATNALPQWLKGLKRDSAYEPAAYNPVYGPLGGARGYTYGGYGPQPTVVTISSPASRSRVISSSSEVFTPSSSTSPSVSVPSASQTLSNNPTYGTVGTSSLVTTGTISSETSPAYSTTSVIKKPLVCNHDNCLRQFLRASAVTAYCATYTKAEHTATTGLPSFVSHCAGLPSRISSACSCLPTPTPTPSTSTSTIMISSSSTFISTNALFSSSSSMSTSTTTNMTSGVEPTTTTIIHVTVTSPITIWYTPPTLSGTDSLGIPSSSSGTSAPYPLSNLTSLVSPTGVGSSSVLLGTSSPSSSILSAAETKNSSSIPSSSAIYPMSNKTSVLGPTGYSSSPVPAMTASNSSSYGIPTYSHDQYHSGKSLTVIHTGASISFSESASFTSSSSGGNPYFPFSNSSFVAPTGPTASGSVTAPLSSTMDNSPTSGSCLPYYSPCNSSSSGGPTGTVSAPITTSNPATYIPIYPARNYSSTTGLTRISPVLSSSSTLSSSIKDNLPVTGSSTSYYSTENGASTTGPVGTGTMPSGNSSAIPTSSSVPPYYIPTNSSSLSGETGTSLPTSSSDTLTTASSATGYGTGKSVFKTATGGPLSSYSSLGTYSNSTPLITTPTTTITITSSSMSSPTAITTTTPAYALPTYHEGHHKHHSEHYYDDDRDEVDLFFEDA